MLASRWHQLKELLPEGVHLLAVSKGQPVKAIRELVEIGQKDFGESRLQEALPKIGALDDIKDLHWHFIGRLQSNKVRNVIRNFSVLHSVDSLSLAKRISRIAGEERLCPEVMLQVKLREDPNKTGMERDQLLKDFSNLLNLPNVQIKGLMTIAPMNFSLDQCRNLFEDCRDLADDLGLPDCSMGMSRDWNVAIACGATWVRLGSCLFGIRTKVPL